MFLYIIWLHRIRGRRRLAYYCNFSLEYDLAQRIEEQLCLPTIDVSRPMRSVVGAVRHRAAGRELIHVQERMFGHIRGDVREQSLVYAERFGCILTFVGRWHRYEHGPNRQVQELPNLSIDVPADVYPRSNDGDGSTAVVSQRQRIYAPRTNLAERGIFGVPVALHLGTRRAGTTRPYCGDPRASDSPMPRLRSFWPCR